MQFPLNYRARLQGWSSAVLIGGIYAVLPARSLHAQTAASAAVASNGVNIIESTGVYPTTANGSNHYLNFGAGGTYPSFATLDFTTGSFGLTAPVSSVNSLMLDVTESNYSASKAGSFTVYLTEDTASVTTANGGSPLQYQSANSPGGVGTQLGDSTTLFNLGTFNFTATANGTGTDAIALTLSTAAQSYFDSQLNGPSTNDLRLVLASSTAGGYATLAGNYTFPASSQPTLLFNALLNQPTLAWAPGGATGGAGTWLPAGTAGDTSWSGGPWNSADVAQFGGTGGQVTIGTGGVTATGIQLNSTGYTLGTTGGPSITLAATATGATPVIQVTNATDTGTINAPIAGTNGLNKSGAGTLVLGGTNTYTGGTTISAGTLQVSSDANLGDASGAVTLGGGTLSTVGSLTTARAFSGSGGIQVTSGNTYTVTGVMNAANLTLPGAGTLALTNSSEGLSGGASNAFTSVTFQTGGASLTTTDPAFSNGYGIVNLGGITASHASGTVTLAANANVTGTVTVAVNTLGAVLSLPGGLGGAAVIAKTGAGTLSLGGDNSGLSGTGSPATSFRQGTAGATPVTGGIISIASGNVNPNDALGTGVFDANGGTLSNNTGAPVALPISISLGAQDSTATPGGLVFAGSGANPAITVTGPISLYKAGTTTYQHAITVNTPTTFTGLLTASANTTTSLGLTILGSSTLTLNGTASNTLFEPITIATSGTGSGVIAAADGTFAATTAITLNPGARLTIATGAVSGTVNTINDSALVSFASSSGTFGKIVLSIGTGQETIGGLYLAVGDGTLAAGYQPAGTYGATGSGATHIDNTLFSGTGLIYDGGTATAAVPEPSAWAALLTGLGLLALGCVRRHRWI